MIQKQSLQKFKHNFEQFIKPHKCSSHNKTLNLLCIDSKCSKKGLICQICLTIKGNHKNHDAVDVIEYVENNAKQSEKEIGKDQLMDLLKRINVNYDDIISLLTNFVENCQNIIKNYLSAKDKLHKTKVSQLSSHALITKIIECKFKSVSQAGTLLNDLSQKNTIKQQNRKDSDKQLTKSVQKAKQYMNDLSYQTHFIGRQLRKVQVKVKQILVPKQSSPVILNYEPTFLSPTLLMNNDLIYIGESKDNRPQGKGICFFKKSQKIVYGQFSNGKVDGMAQMYYGTGDYYLGQFKSDKKSGRGVHRWNGKESNVYQGLFKEGRRHGKGTFWWSDGTKYTGQFKQGNQTGYGTLYRTGNTIQYQGFWLNGQFHGKGVQNFENGEKFQGNFMQDKFHGEGVLHKKNQTIYGVWKENQLIQVREKGQ